MKRSAIVIFSIVAGWMFATFLSIGLHGVGINVPAGLASSVSQYSTYSGAEILLITLGLSWAMYLVLTRHFTKGKVDHGPAIERLPSTALQPSRNLSAGGVIAFVAEDDPAATIDIATPGFKVCPDCGEEVRYVARICRFCRYVFTAEARIATTSQPTPMASNPAPSGVSQEFLSRSHTRIQKPADKESALSGRQPDARNQPTLNDGGADRSGPLSSAEPIMDRRERGSGTFLVESSEVDYLEPRDVVHLAPSEDGLEVIRLGAITPLPFVGLGAEALDRYILQLSLSGQPIATLNWCDEGLDARGVAAVCS